MSTYLIASNEMMCRVLARRLNTLNLPQPITWRTPQWLQEAQPSMCPAPSPASAPPDPADIAVVDCTGLEGDPRVLLDQLQARLAPRRWLVLSDRLEPALIVHAALLGASGCLALPAAVDLVCAATALVWAGGQCFPRMALSLAGACPVSSSLVCASRPTTTG
ncbi:DNA-binding response regulator [Cupriavidus sp. TMH.W2]|uniref:DNA-binding response regulator n=1 Tax=Cupriavidus sp. TMH.W2 TaxID=3434465 RepID=UPI003D776592